MLAAMGNAHSGSPLGDIADAEQVAEEATPPHLAMAATDEGESKFAGADTIEKLKKAKLHRTEGSSSSSPSTAATAAATAFPAASSAATIDGMIATNAWDAAPDRSKYEIKVTSAMSESLSADTPPPVLVEHEFARSMELLDLHGCFSPEECAALLRAAEGHGFGRTSYPQQYRVRKVA